MGLLDGIYGSQTQQEYYDGNEHGSYQFTSLDDVVSQFMVAYVGEDKIISKIKRADVVFHARRAMQELSFDTFKSFKSQEIILPASLQMILPQYYVNYTKVSCVGSSGIKHPLYPTSRTSNPTVTLQDDDGDFTLQAIGTMTDTSQTIVLDAEYKNVLVGMKVSSPNIPNGSIVYSTTNSSSITTIQIAYAVGGSLAYATYTGTETLTFTNSDGSLILPKKSSHILENITYTAGEDKLTQSPNTEVSDIKVGMLVYNQALPVGTIVTDVNGAVITISNLVSSAFNASANTEFTFIETGKDSTTWANYKSATPAEVENNDYQDDTYWPADGERYGLDPQHAQANGSFYIDQLGGKIHFSSNIAGKTVVLDYIIDSIGTDGEMQVHKLAEEAIYKWVAYAILNARSNVPEYQVARFKKERFAEVRKAKLRLSNIKLEEITQILRGKSKHIKH